MKEKENVRISEEELDLEMNEELFDELRNPDMKSE